MGTSNWQNISYCISIIRTLDPQSILDIGVGFGRWGILCREFLEVWEGKTYPENWSRQIDGIEIFEKNIQPWHSFFYNNLIVGDAYEKLNSTPQNAYDLIIIGDVLEHFIKEKGVEFLYMCLDKGRYILLIIPLGPLWPQTERDGNIHEAHRSVWYSYEVKKFCILKKFFRDYLKRRFGAFVLSKSEKYPNVLSKKLLVMGLKFEIITFISYLKQPKGER